MKIHAPCTFLIGTSTLAAVLSLTPLSSHASLLPQIDALTQSDIVITGARWVGEAVCNAGDVNGDGLADIVVTAPGQTVDGKVDAGSAYIVFGSKDISRNYNAPEADVEISNPTGAYFLGYTASNAGDVNGDGYDDVLIGRVDSLGGGGTAYLILGRKDFPPRITLPDEADVVIGGGGYFSVALEIGGDVNGDGIDDMIIGATSANPTGKEGQGAAYLFYGRTTWIHNLSASMNADVIFAGAQVEDSLGQSVACSGDVNGDGLADVVLGAPEAVRGGAYKGEAYIIYGKTTLPGEIDLATQYDVLLTTSEMPGSNIGIVVTNAGDVNSDGINDVIVTSTGATGLRQYSGEVYIVFGSANLARLIDIKSEAQVRISGPRGKNTGYGTAISSGGDVNGDGIDDFIIGGNGEAYCVLGRRDWPPTLDMAVEADCIMEEYYLFGESVSNGGDVNGDGLADIIVGDSLGGPEGASGAAYVVYGSPLPLGLTVRKNCERTDNARVFRAGQRLSLEYSIYPSSGKPAFDQGVRLEAALGVQIDPDYPYPTSGGQIQVYEPGLEKLTPLPTDLGKLTPTFGSISFPPLSNPLTGTIGFTVPSGTKGRFCFIGTIYDPASAGYPAGIARSNIFKIE